MKRREKKKPKQGTSSAVICGSRRIAQIPPGSLELSLGVFSLARLGSMVDDRRPDATSLILASSCRWKRHVAQPCRGSGIGWRAAFIGCVASGVEFTAGQLARRVKTGGPRCVIDKGALRTRWCYCLGCVVGEEDDSTAKLELCGVTPYLL